MNVPTCETDSWVIVGLLAVGLYVTTKTGVELSKKAYRRLRAK